MRNLWPTWISQASLACLLSGAAVCADATHPTPPQKPAVSQQDLEAQDHFSRQHFLEHEDAYASIKADLGILYSKQDKPARALFYLLAAIALQERAPTANPRKRLRTYYHLVQVYQTLGAPQSARACADKLQEILKKHPQIDPKAFALGDLNTSPEPTPTPWRIALPEDSQEGYGMTKFLVNFLLYGLCIGIMGLGIQWNNVHTIILGLSATFLVGLIAYATQADKVVCTEEGIRLPKHLISHNEHNILSIFLTAFFWFLFPKRYITIPYADIHQVTLENSYEKRSEAQLDGLDREYPVATYTLALHATVGGVKKTYTVYYEHIVDDTDAIVNTIPDNFLLLLKLVAAQDLPITFVVKDMRPLLTKQFGYSATSGFVRFSSE